MSATTSTNHRFPAWLTGVIAGVLGSAAAIAFLFTSFASSGSVSALEMQQTTTSDRVTHVEAWQKFHEDDDKFIREQLWKIAGATGAPVVPAPVHPVSSK